MNEAAEGQKLLKVVFWNPREIAAQAATTIVDVEGRSRCIGEFLHSLPKEKRVAVRKIHAFTPTENHERLTHILIRREVQELADATGLSVDVYICERGQHTEPEFQFRADPRPR